jgi:hypothetical protein
MCVCVCVCVSILALVIWHANFISSASYYIVTCGLPGSKMFVHII